MSNLDHHSFVSVFKDAYEKCFGIALEEPLSEAESKHFSNRIFDSTGLVIGAKSLKNYSGYVLDSEGAKLENPSAATLDTLTRYVVDAPFSDESQRKEKEGHYPYWFTYKSKIVSSKKESPAGGQKPLKWLFPASIFIAVVFAALIFLRHGKKGEKIFIDHFQNVSEDTLSKHGWMIQLRDSIWWGKRYDNMPGITLFTLKGDNWPDSANALGIKNFMIKKLESDCFSVELHMDDFIPAAKWQQAGILLMEDTIFTSRSVRITIGYNDFFGGYQKPNEIILQIFASGGKTLSKPEEIAHIPLLTMNKNVDSLVKINLRYSALRIEKNKDQFRFLYSASPVENFALKEAFAKQISIKPKYVGIFALQGFVNSTNYTPVHIPFFSLSNDDCGN